MRVYEWLMHDNVQYHLVGVVDDTHALYTSNRTTGGADRETMTIASDGTATDSTGTITYTPVIAVLEDFIFQYWNFPLNLTAIVDGNTVLLDRIDALVASDMRFRCMYHDDAVGTPYEVYQVSQGVYNIFRAQSDGTLLLKATVTV